MTAGSREIRRGHIRALTVIARHMVIQTPALMDSLVGNSNRVRIANPIWIASAARLAACAVPIPVVNAWAVTSVYAAEF